MLIKCSECEKMISDRALACSFCGSPIEQYGTTTIQETGKTLTLHYIYAFFMVMGGIILAKATAGTHNENGFVIGVLGAIAGLLWIIATKFRVWWHHK